MTVTMTIGSIATFRKGSGLAKSDLVVDGVHPCIHYGELFTRYGAVIDVVCSRTDRDLPVKSEEGDVLMPTSDVTPRGLAKASAILSADVSLGGDILIIRPDRAKVDSRFLAYAIRHNVNKVLGLVRGSTVYHLYAADMRYFDLPSLPLAEQSRVADALKDSDDLINSLERLITKKQAIRQGMMQELLTGRTRLPGFNGPWSKTILGSLGTFLKGRGIKRDDVQSTGTGCIRYGELYTTFNNYTNKTLSFVPARVAATALPLRTGDLLFAGSGETRDEIGKCVAYIGATPVVAGGDVIVLRGDQFNPVYLALLANTPAVVTQKARAGQGDAVVHIYSHALAAIEVDMPSRAEQDAVARLILDVDHELALLRKRLSKARSIKQGIMQELLTGRTRLPIQEAVS